MKILSAFSAFLFGFTSLAAEPVPDLDLGDVTNRGRKVQRTMRLLAESTPERRNTVRILFYGQSITAGAWPDRVIADLKRRFPHANLIAENRALGGFAAQNLVKTAETDLYDFQPDLLVFHVYGSDQEYENIIRRTRERTTAEILLQNDHLKATDSVDEKTDHPKADRSDWTAFMNFSRLPGIAEKYGAELCDQRSVWKNHLRKHHLAPPDLLSDQVHLNPRGHELMAAIVGSCLRRDPKWDPAPAEAWVKTYQVGSDVSWSDGKLTLPFDGNAIEVIAGPGGSGEAAVTIVGRKPSEFEELYGFTRAQAAEATPFPIIADLHAEALPVVEDWTMEVRRDPSHAGLYTFHLSGSVTGPDGEGRSDTRFVSDSRRVVIEPQDWLADHSFRLAGIARRGKKDEAGPETFTVRWSTVARFVDSYVPPAEVETRTETRVKLFHGLRAGQHTLEILGGPEVQIQAIRVHQPPLHHAEPKPDSEAPTR